jgi:hypothetical protein
MQWWRDTRFGMFFRWGLYCITAGALNSMEYPQIGKCIMGYARNPVVDYKQLAKLFNPVE